MIWNLPNTLTWLRILAIPLVVTLFYMPVAWADPAAGLLFTAAAITDSLDGYLARRMGQTSRLGAFLDPVADKLIVAVALVLLVSKDPRPVLVLTACVIIGREIAISALREWMAELGQRTRVAVSPLGKYKTILQMVGLAMLLYRRPLLGIDVYWLGMWLTVLAAVLTLWSMISYLRAAWPALSAQE
ncbi:MAG: CDP-diacylglycerol--glycerol-3-phosphate 3-phosphatidyltransferase [Pseudomonadota bacterium]